MSNLIDPTLTRVRNQAAKAMRNFYLSGDYPGRLPDAVMKNTFARHWSEYIPYGYFKYKLFGYENINDFAMIDIPMNYQTIYLPTHLPLGKSSPSVAS